MERPTEEPKKHPDAMRAWAESRTMLCDRCADPLPGPIEKYGDIVWGGDSCTPLEYVERAKPHPFVWIVCQPCVDMMPDADEFYDEDGQEYEMDKSSKGIVIM